jgi:hypothetical protein
MSSSEKYDMEVDDTEVYAEVSINCLDVDKGENMSKNLIIKFKNMEIYNSSINTAFDTSIRKIGQIFDKKYKSDFSMQDTPELVRFIPNGEYFDLEINE